ncbi:MAG TPA: hypothetical protein VKA10_00355, partial [Prolixibacteraceae bacterium]|nr:hypothetical protein [Prolixibacteraceae bacterium]
IIGSSLFILLGIYALYTITAGYFSASEFLTPTEIVDQEMDEESLEGIPFHIKLLPAYWSFIVSGALAIPAIYFDWKEKKPKRLFILLAGLSSLFGFFIVVGELRML